MRDPHQSQGTRDEQPEAIVLIESGRFAFYVSALDAPPVWVEVVRPRHGTPYLRTQADQVSRNNLDNLPECPP